MADFHRVKNGQHWGILKIMILHCPSTHKQALVPIFWSSFRKWISSFKSTVIQGRNFKKNIGVAQSSKWHFPKVKFWPNCSSEFWNYWCCSSNLSNLVSDAPVQLYILHIYNIHIHIHFNFNLFRGYHSILHHVSCIRNHQMSSRITRTWNSVVLY